MATVFERAAKEFGLTDNPGAAGYILPDGTMLDFSEGSGERVLDHRAVARLYRNRSEGAGTVEMLKFMKAGAVRMMMTGRWGNYWTFLNVIAPPTEAQWATIAQIVRDASETVFEVSNARGEQIAQVDWAGFASVFEMKQLVESHVTKPDPRRIRQSAHERNVRRDVLGLLPHGWDEVVGVSTVRKWLRLDWSDNAVIEATLDWAADHQFRDVNGRVLRRGSMSSGAPGWYWSK